MNGDDKIYTANFSLFLSPTNEANYYLPVLPYFPPACKFMLKHQWQQRQGCKAALPSQTV
jgi:hypothetical protein